MTIGVLQGRFSDFELSHVLEVVGIGRQYTGIEVRRDSGISGTIFMKSGKIVRVEGPDAEGRDALFKLFGQGDGQFFVFRSETPFPLPEPLGSVDALLKEVSAQPPRSDWSALAGGTPSNSPPEPTTELRSGITESAPSAPPGPPDPPPPRPRTVPPRKPPAAVGVARVAAVPPRAAPLPAEPARRSIPRAPQSESLGKVVAISSPKGGCGKTTISLNLALSLARQGRSVILVDADVNGDVLSTVNARERAEIGTFDVLIGVAGPDEALLHTVLPNFKILPAVGSRLPRTDALMTDHSTAFRALLMDLAKRAEVVIVDCPSGMFGATYGVLYGSTHVIGVLQAEAVANRSFTRFLEGLRTLPDDRRPEVLGIVVNMLQTKHPASLSVFQSACNDLPGDWLFDTSIPRHRAFLDATHLGLPLRHMDEQAPPAVAFLFDNLAAEVTERLRLGAVERKPQPLLL